MNDKNLTSLLDEIKVKSVPPAPENLEATVLRNIRTSPATGTETINIQGLFRLAVVIAIFAVGIGWFIGSSRIRNSEQAGRLIARNALSLEAFDSNTISFSQPRFTNEFN